ncbi:MAG TPA: hypothetical protein VKP67_22245 [Xanthobacteraceae bacterium]|nr:hypothetical protein [Xanthobacteraceae bacterium]
MRFPIILKRCYVSGAAAGLVPATPIVLALFALALCPNIRGRRDKPGDDRGM